MERDGNGNGNRISVELILTFLGEVQLEDSRRNENKK